MTQSSLSSKTVGLYCRVSTQSQDVTLQLEQLRSVAEKNNWLIVDEYIDSAISGIKGRDGRPEYDRLCKDISRRRFDLVAAFDASRISRSVKDLCIFIEEIKSKSVDLFLFTQGIDTSTPYGSALLQMIGIFSSLEREMIRERVQLGIDRAKKNGVKFGRPTNVNDGTIAAIRLLREKGMSIRKIARELGIGVGTLYKLQPQNGT